VELKEVTKIYEKEPENAQHFSVQGGGRAKRATPLWQRQGLPDQENHFAL
jgi:hypothetical protein